MSTGSLFYSHPSSGHGHCLLPMCGLSWALKPPRMSSRAGTGLKTSFCEQGSMHKPCVDAWDAPVSPSALFLQPVLPAPTCAQPRAAHAINSASEAAFVGKGVLKGKMPLGREETNKGITSPSIPASTAECSV